VLLSQPDTFPDLSRQAIEFANQSILILSPAKHTAKAVSTNGIIHSFVYIKHSGLIYGTA